MAGISESERRIIAKMVAEGYRNVSPFERAIYSISQKLYRDTVDLAMNQADLETRFNAWDASFARQRQAELRREYIQGVWFALRDLDLYGVMQSLPSSLDVLERACGETGEKISEIIKRRAMTHPSKSERRYTQ